MGIMSTPFVPCKDHLPGKAHKAGDAWPAGGPWPGTMVDLPNPLIPGDSDDPGELHRALPAYACPHRLFSVLLMFEFVMRVKASFAKVLPGPKRAVPEVLGRFLRPGD